MTTIIHDSDEQVSLGTESLLRNTGHMFSFFSSIILNSTVRKSIRNQKMSRWALYLSNLQIYLTCHPYDSLLAYTKQQLVLGTKSKGKHEQRVNHLSF